MPTRCAAYSIKSHTTALPLRIRAAIAGLAGLILAGCGGGRDAETSRETSGAPPSGAANASTAALSPCALLTREQIAEVLQAPVNEPKVLLVSAPTAERAGIGQCMYATNDGSGKTVTVFLRQSPVKDNDPAAVRETITSAGGTVTDISGLGDSAFWDGATLHVLTGGSYYLTIAISQAESSGREQARALALLALTHLSPQVAR